MDATLRIAAIARTEAVLGRIATLACPSESVEPDDASACLHALEEHETVMHELAGLVDELEALRSIAIAGAGSGALDAVVEPVMQAARAALHRSASLGVHRRALAGALADSSVGATDACWAVAPLTRHG